MATMILSEARGLYLFLVIREGITRNGCLGVQDSSAICSWVLPRRFLPHSMTLPEISAELWGVAGFFATIGPRMSPGPAEQASLRKVLRCNFRKSVGLLIRVGEALPIRIRPVLLESAWRNQETGSRLERQR